MDWASGESSIMRGFLTASQSGLKSVSARSEVVQVAAPMATPRWSALRVSVACSAVNYLNVAKPRPDFFWFVGKMEGLV